jgi:hypothetical protein
MAVLNYDPNILRRFRNKTVKLVFGLWEYRLETNVNVLGNIAGADLMTFAVEKCCACLPTDAHGSPMITLLNDKGETLLVANDEGDDDEDWLKKMLVSAEIVAIDADKAGEA